jgi:uracil-DNA glycosylase
MIGECAPANPKDYFYSKENPLFAQTTLQAFEDAGFNVSSIEELVKLGIYLTTAVKCTKRGPVVPKDMVSSCSKLLESEISLFPNVKVIMLMGDAAIQALNCISKRNGLARAIPAGSTYKIRTGKHNYKGIRLFPSYLQAGPAFFVEKSKRKMIAEDIAEGMRIIGKR